MTRKLFGYEAIVRRLNGDADGKFKLCIKLTVLEGSQTVESVVPISQLFGNESAAAVYAENWIVQESPRFLEG